MSVIHHENCLVCKSSSLSFFLKCKDYLITREDFELYQCNDCGFVFTQDVPPEEEIGNYYQSADYISHSDTIRGMVNKLYHLARTYMLSRKRKVIEKICNRQRGKLLDVGSGTGYFINHMKIHGWQVTGIEQDEGARKFAKSQFGLEVWPPGKLFDLPNHQFDVITMWHVLEHIHDAENYLSKIFQLLKEDGCLVIALPNLTSLDASHYKQFWAAYDVPRHLWHFSPAVFEKLINRHNFKIILEKRMPLDAFYVSILSEKYKSSKIPLLSGGIVGFISFINSLRNGDLSSSIIYILKKNKREK